MTQAFQPVRRAESPFHISNQSKPMSLKRILATLLLATNFARADLITDWNETALLAIKADKTPPPKAARALAMQGQRVCRERDNARAFA